MQSEAKETAEPRKGSHQHSKGRPQKLVCASAVSTKQLVYLSPHHRRMDLESLCFPTISPAVCLNRLRVKLERLSGFRPETSFLSHHPRDPLELVLEMELPLLPCHSYPTAVSNCLALTFPPPDPCFPSPSPPPVSLHLLITSSFFPPPHSSFILSVGRTEGEGCSCDELT